ncbi:hypothetical protein FACS1894171_1220 [Clostridia bacterium]|nr:hypothetical protein FACS1894171_1220 [Clostridia bacterium]
MENRNNRESIIARYVPAYTSPFQRGQLLSFLICCLLCVIPFTVPFAIAVALKPWRERNFSGVFRTAGRLYAMGLIMAAPALALWGISRLAVFAPLSPISFDPMIPVLVIAALMAIFGVILFVRLPMAACHIVAGGSVREALSGKFINSLIGVSLRRYIACYIAITPVMIVWSLALFLPWQIYPIFYSVLTALGLYVVGYLFPICYWDGMQANGFEPPEPHSSPLPLKPMYSGAARALSVLFVLIIAFQPVSAYAYGGGLDDDPNLLQQWAAERKTLPWDYALKERLNFNYFKATGQIDNDHYMDYSFETNTFYVKRGTLTSSQKTLLLVADIVTDFVPVVGQLKDINSVYTSVKDVFNEKLSPTERAAAFAYGAYKAAGLAAQALKGVGKIYAEVGRAYDATVDAAVKTGKYNVELVNELNRLGWNYQQIASIIENANTVQKVAQYIENGIKAGIFTVVEGDKMLGELKQAEKDMKEAAEAKPPTGTLTGNYTLSLPEKDVTSEVMAYDTGHGTVGDILGPATVGMKIQQRALTAEVTIDNRGRATLSTVVDYSTTTSIQGAGMTQTSKMTINVPKTDMTLDEYTYKAEIKQKVPMHVVISYGAIGQNGGGSYESDIEAEMLIKIYAYWDKKGEPIVDVQLVQLGFDPENDVPSGVINLYGFKRSMSAGY